VTANNCELVVDLVDDGFSGAASEAERLSLQSENAQLKREVAKMKLDASHRASFARMRGRLSREIRVQAKRDIADLRASEAKAWGLLSELVYAFYDAGSDADNELCAAKTALAARKAGG
jgi:hypothetical protein